MFYLRSEKSQGLTESEYYHIDLTFFTALFVCVLSLLSAIYYTAEEYNPDIPLRIVARSQPVKTKLTTALPKFIIPSVGGNVTSKAIVQEQVAAVTQLPASIRINHTSDDCKFWFIKFGGDPTLRKGII